VPSAVISDTVTSICAKDGADRDSLLPCFLLVLSPAHFDHLTGHPTSDRFNKGVRPLTINRCGRPICDSLSGRPPSPFVMMFEACADLTPRNFFTWNAAPPRDSRRFPLPFLSPRFSPPLIPVILGVPVGRIPDHGQNMSSDVRTSTPTFSLLPPLPPSSAVLLRPYLEEFCKKALTPHAVHFTAPSGFLPPLHGPGNLVRVIFVSRP